MYNYEGSGKKTIHMVPVGPRHRTGCLRVGIPPFASRCDGTDLSHPAVVSTQDFSLEQYPSFKDMKSMGGMLLNDDDDDAKQIFRLGSIARPVRQLLAYETGFVALTADGKVYTWGDERYSLCLGRLAGPER